MKSYMSFQLVPKSVILNDLERRNGPYLRYFTEIGSFRGELRKSGWRCRRKKFTFAISSSDEFLVFNVNAVKQNKFWQMFK